MKNKLPQSRRSRILAFKKALREYNNEPVTYFGMTLKRQVWKEIFYLFTFLILLVAIGVNVNQNKTSPIPVVQAAQTGMQDLNPLNFLTFTDTISGTPSNPSVTPTPTLSPEQIHTWENFKRAAVKVSEMYNFPAKVVIAQGALESARGTSHYAVTRQNYLGIGCYDHDPDGNCFTFENQEQCVIEYMRIIRNNFPEAWEARDNPEKLLRLLKYNSRGAQYATDPNYIQKVMSMQEWSQY